MQDSRKKKKKKTTVFYGVSRRARSAVALRTESKTLSIIKMASWPLYVPCVPGGIVGEKPSIRGKIHLIVDRMRTQNSFI